MEQEIFYAMALTRLTNFNYQQALELYRAVGSAQQLYEHRHEIGDIIKDASPRLTEALKDWDEPMRRAECEMKFIIPASEETALPIAPPTMLSPTLISVSVAKYARSLLTPSGSNASAILFRLMPRIVFTCLL